uniref:Venom peptide n=1 Tax=Dasymutilla klugii TaxID=1175364 RepID=A0A8T9VQD1_DASKL|nr:venom peptide precursor [Dasymutilla klugii]
MNLSTLFFGIVVVFIATVSIFFDNVEASASPDALAAPDALADAEALPLALPKRGRSKGDGKKGKKPKDKIASKIGDIIKNSLNKFGVVTGETIVEKTVEAVKDALQSGEASAEEEAPSE